MSLRSALLVATALLSPAAVGRDDVDHPTSSQCRCAAGRPTVIASSIEASPSGTELEVLGVNAAAEYTHVRAAGGVEGWISSQYLVKQPVAQMQLVTANNRIQALERQLAQRGEALTELKSTSSEAASNGDRLAAQVAKLEAELADVKQVSAGALEEHARSQELASLNARLRAEVDDLTEESQRLESNTGAALAADRRCAGDRRNACRRCDQGAPASQWLVVIELSVNLNKIALLRNSRGGDQPSVLEAADVASAPGHTASPCIRDPISGTCVRTTSPIC